MIQNNSNRVLESAKIDIIVRRPGRSTNLTDRGFIYFDVIVPPGETRGLCYEVPADITDDPKTLEYSLRIWDASAQY